MASVTIENINGEMMTVIRKPFDAEWVRGQLDIGESVIAESKTGIKWIVLYYSEQYGKWASVRQRGDDIRQIKPSHMVSVVKNLKALPRKPKPEDAALLYRYMAEGIEPRGNYYDTRAGKKRENHSAFSFMTYMYNCNDSHREITHAIDTKTGERVEIAIKENDDA